MYTCPPDYLLHLSCPLNRVLSCWWTYKRVTSRPRWWGGGGLVMRVNGAPRQPYIILFSNFSLIRLIMVKETQQGAVSVMVRVVVIVQSLFCTLRSWKHCGPLGKALNPQMLPWPHSCPLLFRGGLKAEKLFHMSKIPLRYHNITTVWIQ